MAPLKRSRSRSVQNDSDTEIFDEEDASSSPQQTSSKKRRISYDAPELEYQNSELEASMDEEDFEDHATQYADTQRIKKSLGRTPADNGIIENVICTNFMCHQFLKITLGPFTNFIIGHNGSGKSAILTAITICLGGKATATNRGQNLKSFIKEGAESSMLSVKLKNSGDSAYQADVYGDSIIVERHFSRSGSSSFKLKSSSGRLISNRKGDLEEICDYFALQIENPMNVLTQDNARQFLNQSTAYDKYKFFMKGTQLEHLDGDYLIVEQNLDAIDQDLYKKLEDIKIFEDRAGKARERLALSERQDVLRQKIQDLNGMMAWAQVEEQERVLAAYEREVRKVDENIVALESNVIGLSEAFTQMEQLVTHANNAVEDSKNELAPLTEKKERLQTEHDRFKAELTSIHVQQREIKQEINAAQARIVKVEKEIVNEYQRLSDADGGVHARRRIEIEEKRQEAEDATMKYREHTNMHPTLEENRRRAEKEHNSSLELIVAERSEIEVCQERMNVLIRNRGQQQQAYPPNMKRLLNAVSQDNGFRQKPIGPMGNHVRLLKPKWSSILEKSFGGALESFIVTSKEDQLRLSSIMQRVDCQSTILIANSATIDTTGKEPDEQFDTVLRVIEIDNELTKKQLIINQGIEQTILIEDRREAINTMNKVRLQNVKQCFSFNVRPGEGLRLGYGYGGGLSQSYLPAWRGSPRMKTDIEYQINSQGDILRDLKQDLNQCERNSREKQSNLVHCEQAIVKHKQVAGRLQIEMQQAEEIIDQLQDALDRDSVEVGKLDILKHTLENAKEEKTTHEGSYEESVLAKDKNNELLNDTKSEMTELNAQINEAQAKVTKAENKVNKCTNQRSSALWEKSQAFEAIETKKKEREDLGKEREEKLAIVEDFNNQASKVCPRVPISEGETYETIERTIKKLTNDLQLHEKRVGASHAELSSIAVKTMTALNQANDEVRGIEELAQLLKQALVNRRDRWRMFQRHITSRSRVQFSYLLSERGYRGKLLANHKEKKLDLMVEPDETQHAGKGHNTKALSGGEKSFSTICLLLSLWEAMNSPIRCLDEFDVFMDSVNREVSIKLIIDAARSSVGRQFILISPQSMGKHISEQEDVKIVKMADPERGQTTLSFLAA